MSLRIIEISQLNQIAERTELLPEELRPLGIVLTFDTLYDAEVFTCDSSERGGTWGVHFNHRDRRQANVKLTLHGYLETSQVFFRNSHGQSQSHQVYLITDRGREMLQLLKDTAGIV